MMNKRGKKAQAQIITTVLLILISIGAIAVVSVFIFNLVGENLGSTDCFDTVGQFEVKSGEDGSTCYDAGIDILTLTIERGQNDYNLTAISVVAGNDESSKSYEWGADLPGPGEKRTESIDVDSTISVTSVTIIPILGKSTRCEEGKAEVTISAC